MDAKREVMRRWDEVADEFRGVDTAPCGARALRYRVDCTHARIVGKQRRMPGVSDEAPTTGQTISYNLAVSPA